MSNEGRPARTLVTGGAGFIGIHAVKALTERGDRILVVDDLRHACGEELPDGVDLVAGELSSPAAREAISGFRPDRVVHLAAQGGVSRSMREPAEDAAVNVVATVSLLKTCVELGVRRLVFASSGGAIYGQADRTPTPEDAPARPLSPYGAAKLACEGYLGMFLRTFGLSSVPLRFGNVYGPHQDGSGEAGVVAIASTRLLAGCAPEIRGDGTQTRDFVYVGDVVAAIIRALATGVTQPLNIGTGVATSVNAVVGHLRAISNTVLEPIHLAPREGEVKHACLDVDRAHQALGWQAATPLWEGLRTTYETFSAGRQGRVSELPGTLAGSPIGRRSI